MCPDRHSQWCCFGILACWSSCRWVWGWWAYTLHRLWLKLLVIWVRLCFVLWQFRRRYFRGSARFVYIFFSILFNRHILIPFYLLLHWHHFYFLLGNYFFLILHSLFNCIVFSFGSLNRHCLHHSPLLHLRHFLLYRHSLHVLPVLILDHLLLVWHVVYTTLSLH